MHAAGVISVNTTSDGADANPDDTICEIAPDSGVCSLRAAIQVANMASDATTIIVPAGIYTLTVTGSESAGSPDPAVNDLDVAGGVTILGVGADKTIINGGGIDRVFEVISSTVDIEFVTIRNGASAAQGSGIYNHATLTLKDSAVSNNGGAGILNSGGTLTAYKTTISGNGGGGITNILSGTVNLNNSTISGNFILGGVYNEDGAVFLRNVTVAQNSATTGGGIRNLLASGTVSLKNTLLAGNSATSGPDCSGTLTSEGYNLIQNTATPCTVTGDTTGNLTGSPGLDTQLKNNGGGMQTHALLTGSPALDAGDPEGCADHNGAVLSTDQRGVAQPQGTRCDIGAYEAIKLRFNSAPYSRAENLGPATVTTTLSVNSPIAVTVNYSTTNGTAIAGSDYVAASGVLTFTTSQTFTISLINDNVYEPNEVLTITLSSLSGAVFDSPAANITTLTIMNDDKPKNYLPLVMNNYSIFFTGSEHEPNNSISKANGPLASGSAISATAGDTWDIFYFDSTTRGTISVSLPGYNNTGHQLQLYYQSTSNNVGYDPVPPYSLQFSNQPAGRYYVAVYTPGPPFSNAAYILVVTYP